MEENVLRKRHNKGLLKKPNQKQQQTEQHASEDPDKEIMKETEMRSKVSQKEYWCITPKM